MNERKFDGKGSLYARFRPSYPQELLEYLYDQVGMGRDSAIADIGAGTGKLTRLLLERGSRVYAVEPNPDMRAAAELALKGFARLSLAEGTAEATGLPAGSVDYITVAQAFHWFDRAEFRKECRRILKPWGKVVLVWNCRDERSELVRELECLNRKFCPGFTGFSEGIRAEGGVFSDFFEGKYTVRRFDHPLYFDQTGFLGRSLSSSYAPKEADENYYAYVLELEKLFDRYRDGTELILPNFTCCYIGSV